MSPSGGGGGAGPPRFLLAAGRAIARVARCISHLTDPISRLFDEKPLGVQSLRVGETIPKQRNHIRTARYTWYSCLPHFLYLQFKEFANMFFLVLSIVQIFPGMSPFGQQATLIPLCGILLISAAREFYEDTKRRVTDRKINHQQSRVYRKGEWVDVNWSQLVVGDIVEVKRDEAFPADIVLLASAGESGSAYIATLNIDGESNLKIRQCLAETSHWTREDVERFVDCGACLDWDAPNRRVYEFDGTLSLPHDMVRTSPGTTRDTMEKTRRCALSPAQLLLRGARLKNTPFILGIVVYAGKHTKIQMSSKRNIIKRGRVPVLLNNMMTLMFGALLIVSISMAWVNAIFSSPSFEHTALGAFEKKPMFASFFGYLVLFNGLLPISLYLTMDVVYTVQAMFIQGDLELKVPGKEKPEVRTASLNSQLGQVEYILSDKTGTLTQNIMEFKQCSVGGVKYGNRKKHSSASFRPRKLLEDLESDEMKNASYIRDLLVTCAVCHTVVIDKDCNEEEPVYHASSPDEGALVKFARRAGFTFLRRTPDSVTIRVARREGSSEETYKLMHVLAFNNVRKRMGVVVRCPDGRTRLFMKGADVTIFSRLAPNEDINSKTTAHLKEFANKGLRTLCFAARVIDKQELLEWEKVYNEATTALVDREKLTMEACELLEKNLDLVGVSAIEDKLQENVPRTIRRILEANIRLWVLTGDKLETAINIGYSCNLLKPRMPLLSLHDPATAEKQMEDILRILGAERVQQRNLNMALIIDAQCLDSLLSTDHSSTRFLQLALCCASVICCRCAPIQKAQITRLVRHSVNGCVLAIGDGGNDVAMIQEADVGVGLTGEEGMQAAQAADYTLSKFHHLERLLLIHGTLSFFRAVKCIFFSMYKNVFETVILFFYNFFNGVSDQPVADVWTIIRFNMFYCVVMPISLGAFDRPCRIETLLAFPELYAIRGNQFNTKTLLKWLSSGVLHGSMVYWLGYILVREGAPWFHSTGRELTHMQYGQLIYCVLILTANLKGLLEHDSLTWFPWFALFGGVAMWYLFMFLDSFAWPLLALANFNSQMAHIVFDVHSSRMYLFALLMSVIVLAPDFVRKVLTRTVGRISTMDVVRHHENHVIVKKRLTRSSSFISRPFVAVKDVLGFGELPEGQNGFAFAAEEPVATTDTQLLRRVIREEVTSNVDTDSTAVADSLAPYTAAPMEVLDKDKFISSDRHTASNSGEQLEHTSREPGTSMSRV